VITCVCWYVSSFVCSLCTMCFPSSTSQIFLKFGTDAQRQIRTATPSCRDPETRISFPVSRWRPTQAASCGKRGAATAAAAVYRQGGNL